MRRIAKISDKLEGYIRLDKIDRESFNVWISECITKNIDITDDTIYDTVEFTGHASNMDLDKDYECKIDADFKYYNTTILKAIWNLKEDVHNYLIDDDDDEDFVEILLDKIIKKRTNLYFLEEEKIKRRVKKEYFDEIPF